MNLNIFRPKQERNNNTKAEKSIEWQKNQARSTIIALLRLDSLTDQQFGKFIENIYLITDESKRKELEAKINNYIAYNKEFNIENKFIADGIFSMAKDEKYISIERL